MNSLIKDNLIEQLITQYDEQIIALSNSIWDIAETRFQEQKSVELLTTFLRQHGFHVTENIADMDTAFVATFGTKGPVIGILGEYDALPGLSQVPHSATRQAVVDGGNGHGCGHNLLGTAGIAAVLSLKDLIERGELQGQIRYYGCPAEEGDPVKHLWYVKVCLTMLILPLHGIPIHLLVFLASHHLQTIKYILSLKESLVMLQIRLN